MGQWRREHLGTLVLSPDTGFKRDYRVNPYRGYYEGGTPFGGTREQARQLDPKLRPMERVLGIQIGGLKKAYPFSRLKKQPAVFEDDVAGQTITIHFDRKSDNAYATTSSGLQVPSMVAFWFAWVDFYPDTLVFGTGSGAEPSTVRQQLCH